MSCNPYCNGDIESKPRWPGLSLVMLQIYVISLLLVKQEQELMETEEVCSGPDGVSVGTLCMRDRA